MKSIIFSIALIAFFSCTLSAQSFEDVQSEFVQANDSSIIIVQWANENISEVIAAKEARDNASQAWEKAFMEKANNQSELYQVRDSLNNVYLKVLYSQPVVANAKQKVTKARNALNQLQNSFVKNK